MPDFSPSFLLSGLIEFSVPLPSDHPIYILFFCWKIFCFWVKSILGNYEITLHSYFLPCDIDKDHSAVIQAGAMQWMGGNVQATSGVKGIGDFLGKALKGAVTKETAVKPEYVGEGCLVLEPTYKYIILPNIAEKIAELKCMMVKDVVRITEENTRRVFKLNNCALHSRYF